MNASLFISDIRDRVISGKLAYQDWSVVYLTQIFIITVKSSMLLEFMSSLYLYENMTFETGRILCFIIINHTDRNMKIQRERNW